MPDEPAHNTGNVNLTDASVRVGDEANVILGHGNTQMVYHGDVVHGNQTIIQQIVQAAVAKLTGSPYKFLSSYAIEDRDIFYGRDAVIEEIAGRVPQHKVVIVNGASGSGKTSLVNAGLLPRLAAHGYTFVTFREYTDPLAQVRDYLTGQGLISVPDDASLKQILEACRAKQETQLVLVLDQFERFMVNVAPKKRRAFIEELRACMGAFSVEEMNVVVVLRQDWLGQMYAEVEKIIPEFGTEAYRYNLMALGRAEAREAIIRPLERVEAKIGYDEAFVDDVLLGSLAQEGEQETISPPHLQIVCHQLFEAANKRYQASAGVVVIDEALFDELGGTEALLNAYLDRTVEEIAGDSEKVAVVRSMLKAMVETTGTRKFISLEDLGGALPDVNEALIVQLLERLSVRRVVEEREQRHSLSHEYMVAQVQSWFDVRELERRKARETLDRGLAAWQTSQSLLDERQVAHIRQWLGALGEDEEALLAKSRRRHVLERWVKIGAVVVLIAVAALSVVLALVMRQAVIAATSASIVNSFDADPSLGEGERGALWTLADESGAVRTDVLRMFLRTGPNASRFNAHRDFLLHALLGIDPEDRIGPLEEAVSQYCTEPDLDQERILACLALARQLERIPGEFLPSIVASIEQEEDDYKLSSLALAFASVGERVDAESARAVGDRLMTAMEQEEDSYMLSRLAEAFASVGERVDAESALAVGDRLVVAMEQEKDGYKRSRLADAFASLGERVDAESALAVGDRLMTAMEQEEDANKRSRLADAFASVGERVDAESARAWGNRLMTAMEQEKDVTRLSSLALAFASVGERVDAESALAVGDRLVTAIEQEEDSYMLSRLALAFASVGERVDAESARAWGDRLVTAIEQEEDSYMLSRLALAFASVGERVDAESALAVGDRLVTAIEQEENPYNLSSLAAAFASLGERVDAESARAWGNRLMTAIEQEENPYNLSSLAAAFASVGERVDAESARAWGNRLMTAMEQEKDATRLSSLAAAFASLGERVDAESALAVGERLVTAIEQEENPYNLSSLAAAFASLGERVDAESARVWGDRLLTVMEQEEDASKRSRLADAFASLSEQLGNDHLLHLLGQPTCRVELQRVVLESLAARAKEDPAALGLAVTGEEWADFTWNRWTFAEWLDEERDQPTTEAAGAAPIPVISPEATCQGNNRLAVGQAGLFWAVVNEDATAPVGYTWDVGDGARLEGHMVNHTFSQAGAYVVTVTAANQGGADTAVCRVEVLEPPIR